MITIKRNPSILTVVAHLGKYCNYNCSYCSQANLRLENFPKKREEHEKILNLYKNLPCYSDLKNLISIARENYKTILNLNLYGGEVSEYTIPELIFIYKSLNIDFDRVTISTNFSKSSEYYKNLAEAFKEMSVDFFIWASYHEEYQTITTFSKKFLDILNQGIKITCQFTLTNNNFLLLKQLSEIIPKEYINVELCFFSINGENIYIDLTKEASDIYFDINKFSLNYGDFLEVYQNGNFLGYIKSGVIRYFIKDRSVSINKGFCVLKNIEIREDGNIDKRCCLSMNNSSEVDQRGLRYCICERNDCRNLNFLELTFHDSFLEKISSFLI